VIAWKIKEAEVWDVNGSQKQLALYDLKNLQLASDARNLVSESTSNRLCLIMLY